MTGTLTAYERRLLATIAEHDDGRIPPATLALSMNATLESVLDTVASLQQRGYVEREAFEQCTLTARGWDAVDTDSRGEKRQPPESP